MKYLLFYLLFLPFNLFGQIIMKLENNESLKKYKSVEINYYYDSNKKTGWNKKINLKEGIINTVKIFHKSKLTLESEYHYDKMNDLDFEIVKYNIEKGNINDTIDYSYLYNEKNQLIESEILVKEFYSNFNSKSLPQTIESSKTKIDSLVGYRTELIYDENGNITSEKIFSKFENQYKIEINNYKYDKFNNLIEVIRNSIPKETYPIPVVGGRFHYEIEKYRYVYNKDNLWIEKYWIVEDKEYLIEKRKFK